VIVTSDLAAAEKAVGAAGARSGDDICVAPGASNGALLVFVAA
jgi:2-phospho-L-lactate guanylyltransferase (CobY/MobA/RfbA family)